MLVAEVIVMTPEQALVFLRTRGWELQAVFDVCWLDHSDPGYRKTLIDVNAVEWEIVLCLPDALVLEQGVWEGDYAGAPTPEDSDAAGWPWRPVPEIAVAV
jgi:hypothetical protein